MPIVRANGIDIYVEIHPEQPVDGGIRVLNITGTGNDLRTSMPERHPLNRVGEVIHYDQRGLGRTTIAAGPYEMADYADDAAGLLDALGWDRCHVVGTSFGGMVAQHLALRHPERVDRLVLNCTSPGGQHPSFPLHTLSALDVEARIEVMLGLLDNRWDPGRDDPIPGLGAFYDQVVAGYRVVHDPETQRGRDAQLDARSRHDTERRLGRIGAPTLVTGGHFDDLAPPHVVRALAAQIPGSVLEFFDGGHLFLLQDRAAFARIIEFLTE